MKKSELKVISLSLAEVVLMLFFLILLVLAGKQKEFDYEKKELLQQNNRLIAQKQALEAQLSAIIAALDVEPDDSADQVLVAISMLDFIPGPNKNKLASLAAKIKAYQEMVAGLRHLSAQTDKPFSVLLKEMETAQLSREKSEKIITQLNHDIEQLETTIDKQSKKCEAVALAARDMKNINKGLADQLELCSNGEGYPPCWRDSEGHIQYMYDIYIGSQGLSVHGVWPTERNEEMEHYKYAIKISDKTINVQQFLSATTDIFQASQQNQCRHFVRIYGEKSAMNADMFTYYQQIQNHFYHLNNIR